MLHRWSWLNCRLWIPCERVNSNLHCSSFWRLKTPWSWRWISTPVGRDTICDSRAMSGKPDSGCWIWQTTCRDSSPSSSSLSEGSWPWSGCLVPIRCSLSCVARARGLLLPMLACADTADATRKREGIVWSSCLIGNSKSSLHYWGRAVGEIVHNGISGLIYFMCIVVRVFLAIRACQL